MRASAIWIAAAFAVAAAAPARAQLRPPGEPGPYVVDLRGATSGIPSSAAFYPEVQEEVAIPGRGFGVDVGAHVYFVSLGPSRVGAGISFVQVRGTAPDISSTVRLLAPQLSFNFGSENGWSYLSAGIGTARVDTELRGETTGTAESGSVRNLNFGGGARWFITSHAAVGFDFRFHRLAAGDARGTRPGTPRVMLVTTSVGVSLK